MFEQQTVLESSYLERFENNLLSAKTPREKVNAKREYIHVMRKYIEANGVISFA